MKIALLITYDHKNKFVPNKWTISIFSILMIAVLIIFAGCSQSDNSNSGNYPLTDQYNQLTQEIVAKAEASDNEEDRLSLYTDALWMKIFEYTFRASAYSYYTEVELDYDEFFLRKSSNEVKAISSSMKKFFSQDEIDIALAVCVNNAFDFFDGSEKGSFDSILGTGWNKYTINLDKLWETYLAERDLLDSAIAKYESS